MHEIVYVDVLKGMITNPDKDDASLDLTDSFELQLKIMLSILMMPLSGNGRENEMIQNSQFHFGLQFFSSL